MNRRSNDILGLDGIWPRPGWVVLDAARETQFTGQVTFDSAPPVDVYFDRGRPYLAERHTDPPIGAKLVDNDALDAAQLARGTVRAGEHAHLGRLFDLVPEVDRLRVLVTLELLTEELMAWVAGQSVRLATPTPYLMHPSGVHRWDSAEATAERMAPLVAVAGPVDVVVVPDAARPVAPELEQLGDDMAIRWSEPSGSVRIAAVIGPSGVVASGGESAGAVIAPVEGDVDVDATPVEIPTPEDPTIDRFEVVWPTGEVDPPDGSEIAVGLEPPTAPQADGGEGGNDLSDVRVDVGDVADEVVLAVRQALAAIEADAIASRPARPAAAPLFHYGEGGGSVATEVRPVATATVHGGSAPVSAGVSGAAGGAGAGGAGPVVPPAPIDPLVQPPSGPAIPGVMANPPTLPPAPPPPAASPDRRRSALRRLVDNLRGR